MRTFKTKSAGAQEAHEAIRPTDMRLEKGSSNEYDQKLYDLIRRRTLASQMAPAKLRENNRYVSPSAPPKKSLRQKVRSLYFDGFLKVYGTSKRKTPSSRPWRMTRLPLTKPLRNRRLPDRQHTLYRRFAREKTRRTWRGRPSTYATIIDTIQTRGYVVRGEGEGNEREAVVLSLKSNCVNREVITEKTGADKGKAGSDTRW